MSDVKRVRKGSRCNDVTLLTFLTRRSEAPPLLRCLNLLNDRVELGPVPGLKLGMKELAIGVNLERPAT